MWDILLSAGLTGLTVFISTYFMMKIQIRNIKNSFLKEENLQVIAQMGAAFASGAMTQLKWGKPSTGGMKFMGIKIPQQVVDAGVSWILKQAGVVLPGQEQQP